MNEKVVKKRPANTWEVECDNTQFYTIKEGDEKSLQLAYHPYSSIFPVTFYLVYKANNGKSGEEGLKVFRAIHYMTPKAVDLSISTFTPYIETDGGDKIEINLKTIDLNTKWIKLHFHPYREMLEEVKELLNDCRKTHLPLPPQL